MKKSNVKEERLCAKFATFPDSSVMMTNQALQSNEDGGRRHKKMLFNNHEINNNYLYQKSLGFITPKK